MPQSILKRKVFIASRNTQTEKVEMAVRLKSVIFSLK